MSAERSILQGQLRHADLSLSRTLEGNLPAISAGLQEMFSSDLLMALSEGSRGTVEIVLADALNKPVPTNKFNFCRNAMGVN